MKLLLALLVSLPASAASVRLYGGTRGENLLRRYVREDARLKARLDDAAQREQAFASDYRDSDLRDAVAEPTSAADARLQLLAHLPGLQRLPGAGCATLSDCSTPELAVDVPNADELPDAVRRMIRPWMLLQEARGAGLELVPSSTGDEVLKVRLKSFPSAPMLVLNVTPRLVGGFKVWFDEPLLLASLYGRERDAALAKK